MTKKLTNLTIDSLYGNDAQLFTVLESMAKAARQHSSLPVTTPLIDRFDSIFFFLYCNFFVASIVNKYQIQYGFIDSEILEVISEYEPIMPHLEVWSVQLYRGKTFGSFFNDYRQVSKKPVAILEYGYDSFDSIENKEYPLDSPNPQSEWDTNLWRIMYNESDICIGGCVMVKQNKKI